MTEEQSTNADKLETIRDELQKVANLFNKAGYVASAYEWHLLGQIKNLAIACELLASK